MKPTDEDHQQDSGWSTDNFQYQASPPTSQPNGLSAAQLSQQTSPANPAPRHAPTGGTTAAPLPPPPATGGPRKGRFNEKSTLLNSDEEFQ